MHRRFGVLWSVVTAAVALVLVTSGNAQSPGVLAPADNLIVEGIPPIPASLGEDVKRYTEFRSAGLADWHPNRREVLISTRFGNSPQIHLVKTPAGARQQLTFFNEPVTLAEFEPRQGNYVVFRRDVGGNEFWQLYRLDLADGPVASERQRVEGRTTLLTDGGRSQNAIGGWSNAGNRIAYTSTRRNGADRDIYVMDPLSPGSSRMVLEVRGGGWAVLDWSPDDRHLLVREYISVNQSHLHLVDVATGLKTEIAPPNLDKQEPVAHGNAVFSADGRGIYLTTDKGSEFLRLAYMDLGSKQLTPITSDIAADVETVALSRDRRRLAFSVNELGISKPYLLDLTVRLKPDTTYDTRRYRPIAGVPDGVISRLVWHANGRDLGIAVGSAQSVSDVYSVDVDTQQVTRWTESELGGLRPEDLSTPSLIRWRSFDGREITGFYSRPPARFTGRSR
jgi:Tol biopolymer transport system component